MEKKLAKHSRSFLSSALCLIFCSMLMAKLSLAQSLPPEATMEEDIFLAKRHIVIVNADLENIWGSYFFAVHNKTSAPLPFKTRVMLPKEAVDFRAQDGLTAADLKLNADGNLILEKEFAPGLSLLGVGFQVKTRSHGNDVISFEPLETVGEFSIAVPKDSGLKLQADALEQGVPPMLAGGRYEGLMSRDGIAAGESVQVLVKGLPKGRGNFWIIGIVTALGLVVLSSVLTLKTKPRNQGPSLEDVQV